MKPRFELGANVLQFSKGMRYPVNKISEKMQVVDRDGSGGLNGEDLGPTIRTRPVRFKGLSRVDYDALVNWFEVIANGIENPFTYYDEEGVAMEVVWMTNPFNFPQDKYQKYSGEFVLEVIG